MKRLVEKKEDLNMVLKGGNKQSSYLNKFEGNLFRNGKRHSAAKAFLGSLIVLKRRNRIALTHLIFTVVSKAYPYVTLKIKRVGGAIYKIPVPLWEQKQTQVGIKWLVRSSCTRKMGSRLQSFSKELAACLSGSGSSVLQKKRVIHELAYENRAYTKYL